VNSNLIIRNFSPQAFLLGLFFSLLVMPSIAYSQPNDQIFILHSYSQEYPWTREQHNAFTSHYLSEANKSILFSVEYLDSKRTSYNKDYADFYADYLKKKYINYRPKFIYVTDDNALNFAIDHLSQIFPETSVIFSGVNDYKHLVSLDFNQFTGVFEKKEISPNIELLDSIDSNIREILVVGDDSNTFKHIKQEIQQQLKKQSDISAHYIASNKIEVLVKELHNYNQKYLFLTTIGAITNESGNRLSLKETIKLISSAGDFIIVSMEDAYLFEGVLGGYVTSAKQQGKIAAMLALAYANGEEVIKLKPITQSPNEYIFDYVEIQRNLINLPSKILNQATILNRPNSFYERNQKLIVAFIIILTILLLLSMAIFLNILSRKNKKIQSTSEEIQRQSIALEESSNSLKSAQKIAQLGIWECDFINNSCSWSDEMFRILGEKPKSIKVDYQLLLSYVHDEDKDTFQEKLDEALHEGKSYDFEHRIVQKNETIKHVRQTGRVYSDEHSIARRIIGTILDITSMKELQALKIERYERVERYQDALLKWSKKTHESIIDALQSATEISANTLNVNRVSIWLFNETHTAILCQDLYVHEIGHNNIGELEQKTFPNYFRAMLTGKVMDITDARKDERSNEFTSGYLIPNNIYSMLDVPIMYEGDIVGVVCHEQTQHLREWQYYELEFALAIANKVSLSLEIEKRKNIEHELEHRATHDGLTGLLNRVEMEKVFSREIDRAKRYKHEFTIFMVDIDYFKSINDTYGHSFGDTVLKLFAKNITEVMRKTDICSRFGGEEFTVILPETESSTALQHAERLRKSIEEFVFQENDVTLSLTCSIGIASYPTNGDNFQDLLIKSDTALYKAKETGRNKVEMA